MARAKSENLVTQSLLDRLFDVEDWPVTRAQSMHMYRESIKRDVEALLNSRKPPIANLQNYSRASCSVINFGLPDLQNFAEYAQDRSGLAMSILQTLRIFEPRIQNVRVSLLQSETIARNVQFHIEGRVRYDTSLEEIHFDTVLELTRGEYEVK